ncbi:MAG: hydroxymethylglutaryl-CoA reductase, degradative [Candidatus Thermoplasmatota archaeon]|nr:hydroxymethylglutaryl-CoA reductase, degradative [Euryarchaeota archaeon]MBU4032426.1 hydroxymethylglutaryl-CoA reductase, degradative [Candidatus Thermoplasmatota archaeon]MBU4071141.1 hydroxymethylglutaryl-CoA reductase, degradative [Candidatus Thermoplasmatota archaeon]MBU4143758.1 hydroxymethylglutaryl-CoA reductase, degradative [Candidatus Thermoplasmatota archaeon]MBU4591408.1 hydroxymethylglutaryl-CoA reductase, degradative [Candidatus Thermoplasmatota archaeon]
MSTSNISGFYKMSIEERLKKVQEFAGLLDEDIKILGNTGALDPEKADRMVENVIGTMPVTLGIATNFKVNDRDVLVPMATEEPSVIAAASNAAKIARESGGFKASMSESIMIGQIQLTHLEDPEKAQWAIEEHRGELLELANSKDPMLVKLGGGARDLEIRIIETSQGTMLINHLLVNCLDAMGANAVNTMAEAISPKLEEITGGKVYLRIISNLAIHRLARSEAVFSKEALGGEDVVNGILEAYAFAAADPFRCTTHNKGIMNGIDAVVLATGNDFRAIEAGAHAYAAWKQGGYTPLTHYEKNENGDIVGKIELPMAVGLIGGATAVHPTAKACVKILGIKTAAELGEIIASVGLAQNIAALRALATEGIQRGHMSLHARNVVAMAADKLGIKATPELIDKIVHILIKERKVRIDRAEELIREFQ